MDTHFEYFIRFTNDCMQLFASLSKISIDNDRWNIQKYIISIVCIAWSIFQYIDLFMFGSQYKIDHFPFSIHWKYGEQSWVHIFISYQFNNFIETFSCISGVQKSNKSISVYVKTEKENKKLVRRIFIFVIYMIFTTNIIAFLFPIGYGVFGFPGPQLWYFPFPIRLEYL